MKIASGETIPGSARVSRVGCGASPQQSFLQQLITRKVRDREDAITSTRDARATRSNFYRGGGDPI
jgi:hypothetical protein